MKKSTLLAIILSALCLAAVMVEDEKEAERSLELYCEMVTIRLETGDPYLGWPDYKGIYDAECR